MLEGPPLSVDCVRWQSYPKGLRISMLKDDRGPSPFCQLRLVARRSEGSDNIDAWSWQGALPFLSIAFGSEAIKRLENIDAWSWLGALFCRLCLVVRLSRGRWISMLNVDRGPSPFCWLCLVLNQDDSENINARSRVLDWENSESIYAWSWWSTRDDHPRQFREYWYLNLCFH